MTAIDRLSRRDLRALLGLFAVVMMIGGTDMTKVTVALPAITDYLGLGALSALWAADLYALAAGVSVIPAAVLADRFGRQRLYLIGLGVAAAGAALAGTAPNPEALLAARAGQGLGAGILIACTVAIIRVSFLGLHRRGLAYGVWAASFSLGSALGPLLGGAVTELAGWRWVFWINVPILAGCLITARLMVRESRNPDPPSLDLRSALFSVAAVGLLIAGLKGLAHPATPHLPQVLAIIGGGLALAAFVRRQLTLARPFLDVTLFANPLLATSAAIVALTNGAFNGVLYVLTQRFQLIEGRTAVEAGLALVPLAAASAAGALLGPAMQHRLTPQQVIVIGLTTASAGFLLLAAHGAGMAAMVMIGLGAGIIMAIGANAIMSAAPPHRAGDAGAIQESSFAIGAGGGLAVLGALSMHLGARDTGQLTREAMYGVGAEAAIGLSAIFFAILAIGAAILLLSTDRTDLARHCPSTPV